MTLRIFREREMMWSQSMRSSLFMPLTGESSRPPPPVLPCAASFLAQITSQSRRIGVHLPRSHYRRGPPRVPSPCGRRSQRRLPCHVRSQGTSLLLASRFFFGSYSFGLDAHGRIWIIHISSPAGQKILVLLDFPPSYQSAEDTGPTSKITPELGHKPLLCLQIGGRHARRQSASIRRSQTRHNGSWRTLQALFSILFCGPQPVVDARCVLDRIT